MIYINKSKIRCPRCGSPTVPAVSITGGESSFWLRCSKSDCNTFIDTYVPMDFQADFHGDSSRYRLAAGGYGSSKTTMCYKDDEKHLLLTKGRTLIGADTLPQLENTVKKDLENDLPIEFVSKISVQKNQILFKNGHELLYRPLNDEGNLRSLNLTRFHIVEASEVDADNYTQLQTRLRNTDGLRYKVNNFTGDIELDSKGLPIILADVRSAVLETNPDAGWIREDFLLKSENIFSYYRSLVPPTRYYVQYPDPNKATFIIPTVCNYYLPPNFIDEISEGKPEWWINRFLNGSFDYAEGLVYPSIIKNIIPSSSVQLRNEYDVRYYIGLDYGINDNTHAVLLHLDPKTKTITAFDECVYNSKNIEYIAHSILNKLKELGINASQLLKTPVMDGRSFTKRTDTQRGVIKTIGQMFAESGFYAIPAQMDLQARLARVNLFLEKGQLKILGDRCPVLVKEIVNYKFPERTLDSTSNVDINKPRDKNNHGVNALEFAIMEIPTTFDFVNIGVFFANSDPEQQSVVYNPLAPMYERLDTKKKRTPLRDLGDDDEWI